MLSCCQIPQQAAHFLYVFCSQFLDPEAIFKDGCRIEELTITILHPEPLTSLDPFAGKFMKGIYRSVNHIYLTIGD